jgi:hypothetical protein
MEEETSKMFQMSEIEKCWSFSEQDEFHFLNREDFINFYASLEQTILLERERERGNHTS